MQVWIDGTYYDKENAKISVFDHGLLYGDGLFEGLRIYGGKVFKLAEHIDRLYDGAKAILLDIPYAREELASLVRDAVLVNEKRDGYIRLVVTRGVGDLGISPYLCPKASVIVIVDDISLYPRECYASGIPIVTAATRRISLDAFDVRVKSLNYLNNVLAKIEARQAGCMEAVLLNSSGCVCECTGDNIFVVKRGRLLSPSPTDCILDGITRRAILELASGLGLEAAVAPLTRYDLYTADECFMTGTGAELMPVTTIDGRRIGDGKPGPWSLSLRAAFEAMVESQV
jgi:branched-chain amino acid aminotransferase